ncbi:MAG: ATP-dependent Clp protease ATP-binding subunit, partial [Acidobacteriaceae bacterium]|nr:ATP-dependent Clp protease ATP-binding subunit [Acidobacteriaceae bacterium]
AYLAGLAPSGRPVANLLFLGPTGSGKTRIVEATAEHLLNDPRAVIKIDCAEFQHSHDIAKLIGSPPGYLGHRETQALLSQEALNRYHTDTVKLSLVLFDEIEKASDALWNLLLGILDKGVLTLGDNRRVDFTASMIFMTSNLGAAEMNSLVSPRLGFHVASEGDASGHAKESDRIRRTGVAAARRKFTPEFINRLDKMVVFKSLGVEDLRRIVDIELELVQARVKDATADKPFALDVTESAKRFLLTQGTDLNYGARPLKRAIERLIIQPLSNLIASDQIVCGDRLSVGHSQGASDLSFFRETTTPEAWSLAAA